MQQNTQTAKAARMSPLFLALAGITLALASFGYFRLFVDFAGMPQWLALFAVGGLDIAAVLIGKHALTVAADGDSSAPWNFALLLLTGLGAFAQFSHAILAGQPAVVGIVSAAFPVVTVLLFEGQLRRVYRLNGRAAGRLSPPRATVDLVTWLFFTKLAMRATKLAVLDRGLDAESAMMIGERQTEAERVAALTRAPRRTMRRTYAAELNSGELIDLDASDVTPHLPDVRDNGSQFVPDVPDNLSDVLATDQDIESVSDVRRRGALARAVDSARGIVGDDFETVLAVVRIGHPEVSAESVRRTLNRRLTG